MNLIRFHLWQQGWAEGVGHVISLITLRPVPLLLPHREHRVKVLHRQTQTHTHTQTHTDTRSTNESPLFYRVDVRSGPSLTLWSRGTHKHIPKPTHNNPFSWSINSDHSPIYSNTQRNRRVPGAP